MNSTRDRMMGPLGTQATPNHRAPVWLLTATAALVLLVLAVQMAYAVGNAHGIRSVVKEHHSECQPMNITRGIGDNRVRVVVCVQPDPEIRHD